MKRKMEEMIMFAALKRIYNNTRNEDYLTNAVKKSFITAEEKAEIMAMVA